MATGGKGGGTTKKPLTARQVHANKVAVARASARQVFADPHSTREQRSHAAKGANQALKQGRVQEQSIVPHGPAGLAAKVIGNLADAAIHSPAGVYETGKAVGTDVNHARKGDLSFKHSRGLAKALAIGTAQDIRHPLRNPGFTALDLLAVGSLGAGAAARAGAVGKAARAGELGTAAKAVVKAPRPGMRTYREGDLEVQTPNSRNALLRGGQKLHAAHANRGASSARSSRIVGRHLHTQERVVEAANRSDAAALRAAGRKLTSPQETALRVVAEGKPIDERIHFHARQIKQAKSAQVIRDHQQKIALLHASRRYVDETTGTPTLAAKFERPLLTRVSKIIGRGGATATELKNVYGKVEKVAARRENVLTDAGRLTADQIESRRHAPGRVLEGARYEKPTPAKLGKPSPQLERQRAYVVRLEGLHERALTRAGKKAKPYPDVAVKVPGVKQDVTRAITHEEATARLAELDKKYEQAVKKITPHVDPYQGESNVMDVQGRMRSVKQEEQRFRNMKSKKGGAGARYHEKGKSVSQEVRALAEDKLAEIAAKHPGQQFAKEILERDRLREALYGHMPGEQHGDLGTVTKTVTTNGSVKHLPSDLPAKGTYTPITTRLGGALSVARDRLGVMEKAAAKRRKPTGLVGAEDFAGGNVRIPYTASSSKPTGFPTIFKGGEPKPPPSTTHAYTGGLQRAGNFRDRTSQLMAESGLEAERYASVLARRDKILQAAKDEKPAGDGWVPVRDGAVKVLPARVKQLIDRADEGVTLTSAERRDLSNAFDDWRSHVFPDERTLTPEELKGVKWVRHELLDKLSQPRLFGSLANEPALRAAGAGFRELNSAAKGAMLYLAPKYAIPNLLGNGAMALVQQGVAAPMNLLRASVLASKFGPETWARVDYMMGEGFARSFLETAKGGPASAVTSKLATGWSKVVDQPFRRAAFLHEARRAGYRTPEAIDRLITSEGERQQLVEVTQRAWEAIGDYERLGRKEREIVRHVVFFYPWLKVSARYSKHFITEHPVQAAAVAQLGRVGQQRQRQELGAVPSFAEGIFKVGGTEKHPTVSNPSSANIFTAADIAKTLGNFIHGRRSQSGYQLTGMLTPALSAGITELTGRDPFTQQEVKGNPAQILGRNVFGGLPQQLLRDRLGKVGTDQSSKMYTYTRGQALGQFGIGPLGPRGYNKEIAQGVAAKESLGDTTPVQRAYRTVFADRDKLFAEMHRLHLTDHGQLPKPLKTAFNLEAERQAIYARQIAAADKPKAGTPAYHLAKLHGDVKMLTKYHQLPAAEGARIIRWAEGNKTDLDKLKAARAWLSTHYYQTPTGFLTMISASRRYLKEKGAKGL